jgi:diguanylate cyclase (GGDEF)-like protein
MQSISSINKKSLKFRLPLLAVLLAITTTFALGIVTEHLAVNQLKQETGEVLSRRTTNLSNTIDRLMAERVEEIRLQGEIFSDPSLFANSFSVRHELDKIKAASEGYAWIGLATPAGTVLAATDGILEGADVSERPWFQKASPSAFVGDLHPAVLLEKKLNVGGMEPLRLLDIAVPVIGRDGNNRGVLGAHIDWRWVKSLADMIPARPGADFLIIAADNSVLLGPPDLQDKPLPADLVSRLRGRKTGYTEQRWPDGETYLTGYTLSDGHHNYAGLQWLIVERQDSGIAYANATALRREITLYGILIAAVFGALGWLAAVRISRPLLAISDAAEAIEQGDTTARIPKVQSFHEVMVLARTLSSLIRQLKDREAELEHQATHNSLTNLPNRALIKALIDQAIAAAERKHRLVTVVTLGFEGVGHIQNALGSQAGDTLGLAIADRLRSVTANATLGHMGKDEFVVVLQDQDDDLPLTMALTSALEKRIADPVEIEGMSYFVSPVIGVSQFPKDGTIGDTLLGCSEAAMHQARTAGGHSIRLYKSEMNSAIAERLDLERELRLALQDRQFELHYQPQVSLATGEIVGVEALVRWRHPKRGLISPAKFIPVAEASGLIVSLGEWILHAACQQAQQWCSTRVAPLRVAVNVSSRQFSEADILAQVTSALAMSGLAPNHLKLEITESMLMHDVSKSIAIMRQLVDHGVDIGIDDFGTGYSSLSYLGQFPISQLKIDQSFVHDLCQDSASASAGIVNAIISLGRHMKLDIVAEGVETREQFEYLKTIGCDAMQGYYFSKPLPADEMTALLYSPKDH